MLRRVNLAYMVAAALLLTGSGCSLFTDKKSPAPDKADSRAQLSIGYSLLYDEADGIPKLKWLLLFKDKQQEMGRLTNELLEYYGHLAETMRNLSRQDPALRINVTAMSEIESEARKAIGADLAKELAPVTGKTGTAFEREALLMFDNSLNEQRHLVAVMIPRENHPALRQFLEATRTQLDAHYAHVEELLRRRYFTH